MKGFINLYIFLVLADFGCVLSTTIQDVRNLYQDLFVNYDPGIKPMEDQDDAVVVDVGFYLNTIIEVDEREQKLVTNGFLKITWYDEFLEWDDADYNELTYIYLRQNQVWKPDMSLQNGFATLSELGSDFVLVDLWYDGEVDWRPFEVFESKCNFEGTFFPFDKHTCDLDFIAWSLDWYDVELYDNGSYILQEPGSEVGNGEWKLLSTSSKTWPYSANAEPKVTFSITIERKPQFAIVNVIIPVILLSILNIFTFQIPSDGGERMGYSVTVWLAFAVFFKMISDLLPKSSDTIPILTVYIMIQLFMATTTVLISSIHSRMSCRSKEWRIPILFLKTAKYLRRKNFGNKVIPQEIEKETEIVLSDVGKWQGTNNFGDKAMPNQKAEIAEMTQCNDVTWHEAVAALDYVYFRISLALFCVLTVTMLGTIIVFH